MQLRAVTLVREYRGADRVIKNFQFPYRGGCKACVEVVRVVNLAMRINMSQVLVRRGCPLSTDLSHTPAGTPPKLAVTQPNFKDYG